MKALVKIHVASSELSWTGSIVVPFTALEAFWVKFIFQEFFFQLFSTFMHNKLKLSVCSLIYRWSLNNTHRDLQWVTKNKEISKNGSIYSCFVRFCLHSVWSSILSQMSLNSLYFAYHWVVLSESTEISCNFDVIGKPINALNKVINTCYFLMLYTSNKPLS